MKFNHIKHYINIKNVVKIPLLSSFFFLISLLVNLQSIDAAPPHQSLRITPIINDLQLTPGKSTTIPLTVENISNDPVGIHATLSGFDTIGEVPVEQQKQSAMIHWTKLSTDDIILGPKEKKMITVSISPPAGTGQSGFYETIFLTPNIHQESRAFAPVVLSRIGVLVLGTIGKLNYDDLAQKISISHFSPGYTFLDHFPQTVTFTVNNSYFTHFDAKPFLTITPLFGSPQTTLIEDKHVLPGSSRIWQFQPTISHLHVFYEMHLAVSVGGGKQVMADTWFIVIPYGNLLFIPLVLLLLFVVTAERQRFKNALRILIRGK